MWAVLVMVVAAGGEARISVDVEWDAPESCPPRARFEAELRARSSRLRVVEPSATSEAHVSVKVVEKNKRFSAVSRLRTTLSGVTTREFKSAQCETLVAAAALATSMLLDPEGTRLGQVTLTPPPPPEEPDAGAPPEPFDAGVTPEPSGVDAGPVTPEPVDAGAPVVIDAGPPAVAEPSDAGAPAAAGLELGVAGGFTSAISGLVDPLVQLDVALAVDRLRFEFAPSLIIGRRITTAAVGTAQYFGVGGRFAVCVTFPFTTVVRADLGLDVAMWAVPASAPEAEVPGSRAGLLLAPGLLGRIVFSFGRFHVALEGSGSVNTRAEAYVITGSGVVFSAPRFFGGAVVAVGWSL